MPALKDRVLIALACLAGGLGVAASAAAAHIPGAETLKTAGQFLLFHAPAILALAGLAGAGLMHAVAARTAAWALVLGISLFSGDLALRALAGHALFPLAAPSGGILLMLGWSLAAIAAFAPVRR